MYKVLIVEDEDIIRKGLIYMVNWLKHNCVVVGYAVDGDDGLAKIAELRPDIVITDIKMPFKDGIQMIAESRADNDFEAIIISGYSDFDYAKQAISLGVTEYVLKPIDFNKLDHGVVKSIDKIIAKNKLREYKKSADDIKLHNELLDIQLFQENQFRNRYVQPMLEYIKNNYGKKISLQDLSEQFQVSTVYLNGKFKEETNYTFNDFLNRFRITKAVELLRKGDMLVYEAADRVGFQDYKYFSQVFKKYVGASPTQFLDSL